MSAAHSSLDAHALALAKASGLFRAREAAAAGIPATILSRLVAQGKLERVGRGLYQHPDVALDEHASLLHVVKCVPGGVLVLLSALAWRHIGTQSPHQVWLLLPHNAMSPRLTWPPLKVVRARNAESFTEGVETHAIGVPESGMALRVTNPARTVADCFKYRRQVGLDVCLEALREVLGKRQATVAELARHARMNRVENIMRPYLEALA